MLDDNGWDESATAWIGELGEIGDFGRRFVLDEPMLARLEGRRFARALDAGCGEGRFCRMLQARGIPTIGIDPTASLIRRARSLDASGDYRLGRAEALDFPAASFDLVISYLTLVDIPDVAAAIAEMARVLKPGGTLLIANCTSYNTAAVGGGWTVAHDGEPRFAIDDYLTEQLRMGRVARHPNPQLAPPAAHLHGPAAVVRIATAVLRRTRAARRRPGEGRTLPTCSLFSHHGMGKAG